MLGRVFFGATCAALVALGLFHFQSSQSRDDFLIWQDYFYNLFLSISPESFHRLSYRVALDRYGKGPLDALFVLFWIIVLFLIQTTFYRLARSFYLGTFSRSQPSSEAQSSPKRPGKKSTPSNSQSSHAETALDSKAKVEEVRLTANKFCEQSFLFFYYCISLSVGLLVYRRSPYFPFNTREMWTEYPVMELSGLDKSYYLVTLAFWIQQLVCYVFLVEVRERRKDHWQMVAHHLITVSLVAVSFMTGFTRVGNVILIIMDTSDVFLTLAKTLKYLGKRFQSLCDFVFILFTISWVISRHGAYLFVWWSVVFECPLVMYQDRVGFESPLFYYTTQYYTGPEITGPFLNGQWYVALLHGFFILLLTALQGLLIFWFFMILKVIARVLKGGDADDVREDD